VPRFVADVSVPPAFATEVTRKTSFGGLKNVIKLDVNDAAETVTLFEKRDRPGTPKGPRLTQGPSPGAEQLLSEVQDLRVVQLVPRTT